MSTVFFEDRFHEVYGAQENILLLAAGLQARGESVRIVTTGEGAFAQAARSRNLPVNIVAAPAFITVYERGHIRGKASTKLTAIRQAYQYSRQLHRHLRDIDAQLIVASSIRSMILLARTRLARRMPVFLFAQNSTPFGIYAAAALPFTDRIALIAAGSISTFPAWSRPLAAGRMFVMHSGRDLARYAYREQPPARSHKRISIVTVCAITERKGLHVLIEAIRLAREGGADFSLTIVGDAKDEPTLAYRNKIQHQALDDGVPLEIVGWVDDVLPHLQAADIFSIASFHEGLPGVIIEAMSVGLPVVATDAGGCREIVAHESSGYVVPTGDSHRLADALNLLSDRDTRHSMGKNGSRIAHCRFSLNAFIDRFLTARQALIGPSVTIAPISESDL